ncbi:MAG: ribonuclease H [Halanaeroarchaeum sp.]
MAAMGRPTLRDAFDDAPTPHIAHPPTTHHRDYYVATDGSFSREGGGLGVVIEARDGERLARLAVVDQPPDNNVAEYRALHLGLDALASRVPGDAAVGVLLDHDDLASNVNAAVLATRGSDFRPFRNLSHPPGVDHHWRGIEARIAGFDDVRAAVVNGRENPAHPLANAPEEYHHLDPAGDSRPSRRGRSVEQVPPPSRADRHATD